MSDNTPTREILSEPLSPVLFGAYTTLISVTQGVALGAGFFILTETKNIDLVFIFKAFMTFIAVCLVWHRFITFTQYLVWRLGFFDTLIPMSFAILEVFVVLAIPESTSYFFWVFCFLPLVGAFSYFYARNRFATREANDYVHRFFKKKNYDFAADFLQEMNAFAWQGLFVMLSLAAYCVLVSIFIDKVPVSLLSEEMKTYLSTGVFTAWLIVLFYFDVPRKLNHSKRESLKVIQW